VAAVVGTLAPAAVAAVDQRRLVAVTAQSVQPHAASARTKVVADRVAVRSATTSQPPTTADREREKFIHHKANNRCDNQNKLMRQAARKEIPI